MKFIIVCALVVKTHVLKIIFYYQQKHVEFIARVGALAGTYFTALDAWSHIKEKINLIYELKFVSFEDLEKSFLVQCWSFSCVKSFCLGEFDFRLRLSSS